MEEWDEEEEEEKQLWKHISGGRLVYLCSLTPRTNANYNLVSTQDPKCSLAVGAEYVGGRKVKARRVVEILDG